MAQTILLSGLVAWLLVCMIFDLRSREVPLKWTLIPMILAGVYAIFQGQWSLVVQMAALIVVSDIPNRSMRMAFAVVLSGFVGAFDPASLITVIALLTIWWLWEAGAMGGADAKLLMVIALVISQPYVFVFIALAGGIQGIVAMIARQKSVPYIVAIFAGTCVYVFNSLVCHFL